MESICYLPTLLCQTLSSVCECMWSPFRWILEATGLVASTDRLGKEHIASQPPSQTALPLYHRARVGGPLVQGYCAPLQKVQGAVPSTLPEVQRFDFSQVVASASPFNGYKVPVVRNGYLVDWTTIMGSTFRPANLFLRALLGGDFTTLPSAKGFPYFGFTADMRQVRGYIDAKCQQEPNGIVRFTAANMPGTYQSVCTNQSQQTNDLGEVYGYGTFEISHREVQEVLASQRIHLSSYLPLAFYQGLKAALKRDGSVMLPGFDKTPATLAALMQQGGGHLQIFLQQVNQNPTAYGFSSVQAFQSFLNLTIYQVGSMVVKTETYHLFCDGQGKIFDRKADQKDTVRLINACGVRGFHSHVTPRTYNTPIMTETFATALQSARSGVVIFPAVGMGVWGGDPAVYWRALLDAIVREGHAFHSIMVNPGHQQTRMGTYQGRVGDEFQEILQQYLAFYRQQQNHVAVRNLEKVVNLFNSKKDVLQLARTVKTSYPQIDVSIFNASDPDVTLGNHVGEYTNTVNTNCITTEENYTAIGSNGLCFEEITGIHTDNGARIISS